jgi:hypothetical protein
MVNHFEKCGHLILRSVDKLFSSAAQVVTNSLLASLRSTLAMAPSRLLPQGAPAGGDVLRWKNIGLTCKEMVLVAALMGKKCKNPITAIGAHLQGKAFGITQTCLAGGEPVGTCDHCCHTQQAPKLLRHGKKQASAWTKCLQDHGGDAPVARAVWPNHWAGALQAKKAVKASLSVWIADGSLGGQAAVW